MAMLGYFDIFPDKAKTELRSAILSPSRMGDVDPLDGTYIFTEYFCTDLDCDCKQVLVKVFRVEPNDDPPEDVATISHCWGPHSDSTWALLNSALPSPFLDPFHPQALYASQLLDFWSHMVKRDKAYASRLRRHYGEIRAEAGKGGKGSQPRARLSTSSKTQKSLGRLLTKQDRKTRRKRLARARMRQRAK